MIHNHPILYLLVLMLAVPFLVSCTTPPPPDTTAEDTQAINAAIKQFADAFNRYLPSQSVTPQQARDSAASSANRSATQAPDVADGNGPQPAENRECCGVADGRRGGGEESDDLLEIPPSLRRDRPAAPDDDEAEKVWQNEI